MRNPGIYKSRVLLQVRSRAAGRNTLFGKRLSRNEYKPTHADENKDGQSFVRLKGEATSAAEVFWLRAYRALHLRIPTTWLGLVF